MAIAAILRLVRGRLALLCLALVLLGFWWPPLLSAQAENVHSFTVERLVAEAWRISPGIKGVLMLQEAAQAEIDSSYKGFFPAPGVEAQGGGGSSYATFYVRQPIWSAGRTSDEHELAKEQSYATSLQEESVRLQLSLQIISDVETALMAHEDINIYRDGIEQLGVLLRMMERRVGTGLSSEIEIEVVKTRLSSMKTNVATLTATEETALDRLTLVTGLPVESDYIVLPSEQDLPPRVIDMDRETVAAALSYSPDIKSSNSAYRLARLQADISETSLFPTIYAQAQYSLTDADGGGEAEVFVGLDYPLSGGVGELDSVIAANARASSATFDVASKERDLRAQVLSELHTHRALRDFLASADIGIISTSEVLKSYRRQFLVGQKSWLEVLNAVREKVELEVTRMNALIKVATNHMRLRARVGDLGNV
ncbi:MAG: TolC family protein [Rhodospirillales bacterium]|nr:TolC family protein [Rhodospirillales bacterium]